MIPGKTFVAGGTGMLGRPVVKRLLRDGYPVRLLTRHPENVGSYPEHNLEVVAGDVTDPESLKGIIEGCEIVYISLGSRMNPDNYERIEHQGTANLARAGAEQGIGRIAMISGLNVGSADSGAAFMKAKWEAEEALMDSGLPYTIFRCCWFFESLPLFVQGKHALLIGRQPHRLSWMAAADYARMVSRAFEREDTNSRVFHIRGVYRATMEEALSEFCRLVYPDCSLRRLPLWLVSVTSKLTRRKQMRGLAEFMAYHNRYPETSADGEADRILGPALTTLADWVEDYKSHMGKIGEDRS